MYVYAFYIQYICFLFVHLFIDFIYIPLVSASHPMTNISKKPSEHRQVVVVSVKALRTLQAPIGGALQLG